MIYFITKNIEYYNKSINTELFNDITILNEEEGIKLYFNKFAKKRILALDIEATGLDCYLAKPILYGIGTKTNQLMFDWTINIETIIENIKKYKTTILGHNLKYDIKLIYTNTNIMLRRLYDTMIAEQRLWMKSGYGFGLDVVIERYLKKKIIKTTRNEFINANLDIFKINIKHLHYLKEDLVNLFEIRKKQRNYIKKFKQQFLIYGIEFPLISEIADAEVEGFIFDKEAWIDKLNKNKKELKELNSWLDEEVRRLRDFKSLHSLFSNIDPKYSLGGHKYNNIRKDNPQDLVFNSDGTTNIDNIFGESMTHQQLTGLKKKIKFNPNNIDWSSKKDVVYIFASLEEPMITTKETFETPQFNSKGKIIGNVNTYSLKEDLLEIYLKYNPNSIMKELIIKYIKRSKITTAISNFGENYLTKLNPITNKIHTIFRQCDADTGRFQSGGGKKEPDKYNAQNIPRDKDYRKCFTVNIKKYRVLTADYSGAELAVMASHAQDHKLLELSKGDMHSYMATKCWRNIFSFRAKRILDIINKNASLKTDEVKKDYYNNVYKAKEFVVDKTMEERTNFKPMTFGTIYGMYSKKAGKSLNIIPEEGKVVINTIEAEIPDTFNMVKKASFDAEKQGFVILNYRTNSRAWFPMLIKQIQGHITKQTHFKEISDDLSAARNIRIQGTQADFVKEATVVIKKYIRKLNIDVNILSWVHDELVFRIPLELDGKSEEFINNSNKIILISPLSGIVYNNISEWIIDIMENVANRYLENVKIKCEYHVEKTWIK